MTIAKRVLADDRFFDSDPTVRAIAHELFTSVRTLPLVCPHGHVDPAILARDERFSNPTNLLLKPDHYILRMLYSQGVRLEDLGIPTLDDAPIETDPRKIWQLFADNYFLFRGTPTRAWLDFELHNVFGVPDRLTKDNAVEVYEHIDRLLSLPEYRPRALFDRFNIEVLSTTDSATDTLEHHQSIRESDWAGNVIPCFRPDALFRISSDGWRRELDRLSAAANIDIRSFADFVHALEDRRAFFSQMGATATDHAVETPYTHRLSNAHASELFEKGRRGRADAADQTAFEAHMLMEMAGMSIEDGLVMQLHAGSLRNHNQGVRERFGPDIGADIPVQGEFTRNLRDLLNEFGNDSRFRLIVFTLDETTLGRELAPLAGHYPSLILGPAWWFFDSIEGMRRHREHLTETAGFYNSAGFNDDTRAFISIPARHDLSRRVDANFVAGLVARHALDIEEAHEIMHGLAYAFAKKSYNFTDRHPN